MAKLHCTRLDHGSQHRWPSIGWNASQQGWFGQSFGCEVAAYCVAEQLGNCYSGLDEWYLYLLRFRFASKCHKMRLKPHVLSSSIQTCRCCCVFKTAWLNYSNMVNHIFPCFPYWNCHTVYPLIYLIVSHIPLSYIVGHPFWIPMINQNYPLVMTNIALEYPPIFKNGKPSISIRAVEKPWRTVSHNQRVN